LRHGGRFVGPTEPGLFAGVASLYLEIFDGCPEVDTLIVPVGSGSSATAACLVREMKRPSVDVFGVQSEFVRTPKHGIKQQSEGWVSKRYKAGMGNLNTYLELLFGLYFVFTIGLAVLIGSWVSIPFLVLFMVGFLYVGTLSLHQLR